jgi:hypothetical protein
MYVPRNLLYVTLTLLALQQIRTSSHACLFLTHTHNLQLTKKLRSFIQKIVIVSMAWNVLYTVYTVLLHRISYHFGLRAAKPESESYIIHK